MLTEIMRYELAYRLRSPATWLFAGFLVLISIVMFLATADGGVATFANAPERIAGGASAVGTVAMLVSAALFGDAAVRDVAAEMDSLLYTTPISKRAYLGGRFLASWIVNALLLLAIPIGFLIATQLVTSMQSVGVGPFRFAAYAQSYALMLLPNLTLSGVLLFAVGVKSRSIVPVYLCAIGLFIGFLVVMNGVASFEHPLARLLGDPLGINTLQSVTQYWPPAERNVRSIGIPLPLLVNRAVWLTIAAAVFSVLAWRFRFAHAGVSGSRRRIVRDDAESVSLVYRPVKTPRIAGTFQRRSSVQQTLAVARRSLQDLTSGRWFPVVVVACIALTLLMGWNVSETVFDTSTWPITMLVAETVLAQRVAIVIYALIVLFAGELVWSDREWQVHEIADAAPIADGAVLAGRLMALLAMTLVLQTAMLIGGLLIQALQGYYTFEPLLYVRIVYGLQFVDYALFAVLAMLCHVLVNHKYVGHLALLLAVISALFLRTFGVLDHHLLLYNTDPGWTYSDMNGFGPFIEPVVWFKMYWAAWAFVLAIVAALFWVRGREPGLKHRLIRARLRATAAVARWATIALVCVLCLGGFVFYNTNVLNTYESPSTAGLQQAEYERQYKQYEATPQPSIVSADLRVELHPAQSAMETRGTYTLRNRERASIDSIHIVLADPLVQLRSVTFDRASSRVVTDLTSGYHIFALRQALAPGDSLQLTFEISYRPRGFPNSDLQTAIVANGSHFNRRLLPIIGYQRTLEVESADARERLGLPVRSATAMSRDSGVLASRWALRDADLVHVRTVIGTDIDQVAVTPGVLRRTWTENGRRYFHYETDQPTAFGATIFSARYDVAEDAWNGVPLRVYHHPGHRENVEGTLRSMKASLAYYTAQFGPYPDNQLRVVEFPRYGGFGSAHPHTIAFSEAYFFSRVKSGEVDQPFYGTAHEIAHTWWGGMIRGAPVKGHGLLTESLANYSAMMVTEKTFGVAAARRVFAFQLERYLLGRASQSLEVPLLDVQDQPYLTYRKGALALYILRERLGEETVNGALRRYVEKFGHGMPPYPTSRDLYTELQTVTPDSLRPLLADLFERVTLWDVRAGEARAERTRNGEYSVSIDVQARKLTADSIGRERDVPMDEFVEIGVFAAGDGDGLGIPLYVGRHPIRSGAQTIRVTVPSEPARAGIDPYRRLIDRDGADNVVTVKRDLP